MNPPQIELSFIDKNGFPVIMDIAQESIPQLSMTMQITDEEWDSVAVADAVDTSIELPETANNAKIFGYYGVPEVRASVTEQQKNMLLKINGLDSLRGYAVIKSTKHANNGFKLKNGAYSVQLFGGNASWFSKLANKLLADYNYTDHNQLQDDANVLVGIDAKYGVLNFGYLLVKYGSTWQTKTGGGTLYPDLSEFTRFVFVKHLLDLIQQDAGIEFVSDFFNTGWFKTLIIPLPAVKVLAGTFAQDYLDMIVGDNDAVAPNNPIIFDYSTQSPIVGAPWLNFSTGEFTAPYKGTYKFMYSTVFTYIVASNPASIGQIGALGMYKNGVLVSGSSLEGYSYNVPGSGVPPPDLPCATSMVLALNAGDVITFRTLQFFTLVTGSATNTIVQVTGEAYVEYGAANQPSYPKYLFRDWQVKDFIKGLTQLFRLKWQTSKMGNRVFVEPASDYWYSERFEAPNLKQGFYQRNPQDTIGQKIDFSQPASTSADAFRFASQFYNYKKDPNDEYMKSGDKEQIPILGCKAVLQGMANENSETRENAFFAGTVQIFDIGATYRAAPAITDITVVNSIQVPLMLQTSSVNENDKFNFLPRILVFRRQSDWNDDGALKYTFGQTTANLTNMRYPIAYVANMQNTNGWDMPLTLGNLQVGANFYVGLVGRFYAEYFGSKLLNSKILSAFFFLSVSDVQSFDFRKKIFFQNIYYKVVSIENFNPLQPESPTQLLLEPEPFDRFSIVGQIINSPISPIVT